jgi:hypothetical protein
MPRKSVGGIRPRLPALRQVRPGDDDARLVRDIPKDDEATLDRARAEAGAMLRLGLTDRVYIRRVRIKLPSGVSGYRHYCLDRFTAAFFGLKETDALEVHPPMNERVPCLESPVPHEPARKAGPRRSRKTARKNRME